MAINRKLESIQSGNGGHYRATANRFLATKNMIGRSVFMPWFWLFAVGTEPASPDR